MEQPPSVVVLSADDVTRIDGMLSALGRALDALFDRRLVEPRSSPDDRDIFDDVADKVHRDYLF